MCLVSANFLLKRITMIMIMNSNDSTTTNINSCCNNDQQQQQEKQQTDDNLTTKDLNELLTYFSSSSSSPYRSSNYNNNNRYNYNGNGQSIISRIENQCIRLISKDYSEYLLIENDRGQLSTSYPSKIIIPEIESNDDDNSNVDQNHQVLVDIDDDDGDEVDNIIPIVDLQQQQRKEKNSSQKKFDIQKLKDLIGKARVARCRARFPVPVILYKDKYICRSATLSSAAEIFGRSVLDYTFNDTSSSSSKSSNTKSSSLMMMNHEENVIETIGVDDDDDFIQANHIHIENNSPPPPSVRPNSLADSTKLFTYFRNQDIRLLKYLNVKLICDLMLEKKKVKFGMNVTSSEKADKKNRYQDFNILTLPYPGCEFFREYRDNSYSGEGLIYDWNQDFVDAEFGFNNSKEISRILQLNFNDYRKWDVINLTRNYIKLILYFLNEFDSSILIHCISGWDRTPLFISLLRLTLWADGKIHRSLTAVEICYLTVAYDWLLFGHNLNDRLNKGEEIMFFCFQFLKFITDDEFCIDNIQQQQQQQSEQVTNEQDEKIERKISTDSFTLYEDFVIENIPINNNNNVNANCNNTSANNSIGSSSSLLNQQNNNKPEDSYSLVSTFEFEQQQQTTTTTKDIQESLPSEMIATLTLNDVDDTVNHFGSSSSSSPPLPIRRVNNSFNNDDNLFDNLHSSTQPVQIPIVNNNHHNHHQSNSLTNGDGDGNGNDDSLCRSDSWQFVSEASSIIDNHSILNQHFSSPESFSSLANNNSNDNCKKSSSPSLNPNNNPLNLSQSSSPTTLSSFNNQSNNNKNKNKKKQRYERLLEVRSLFNSAYMSINFHHNNGNNNNGSVAGGLVTNFMDQLCRTVNI
ncbi:egg-derived tyrosine phosphatase [Dermatophagoides pteronyssinus]|uniref:egg-derived tyrosine phosphatase n=1 Tax=Dermatophagoides pteronyssinus TaxID=6956 RepID=UPI003F671944